MLFWIPVCVGMTIRRAADPLLFQDDNFPIVLDKLISHLEWSRESAKLRMMPQDQIQLPLAPG